MRKTIFNQADVQVHNEKIKTCHTDFICALLGRDSLGNIDLTLTDSSRGELDLKRVHIAFDNWKKKSENDNESRVHLFTSVAQAVSRHGLEHDRNNP